MTVVDDDQLTPSVQPSLIEELRATFAAPKTRRRRRPVVVAPRAAERSAASPKDVDAKPAAYPALRSTPARARLAMPQQNLDRDASDRADALADDRGTGRNRAILLLGAFAFAVAQAVGLAAVLGRDGAYSGWEVAAILLSSLLGGWLAFGFIGAVAGFLTAFSAGKPRPAATGPGRAARTAVLLPVYNEDPGLVLAAIQAMAEEVRDVGLATACDFFILSDTRVEEIARAEATGLLRLRARLRDGPRIYYRRRARNTDRKAGNIGEWVETYGGRYDYMLVLDADSLMSGEAIAELVTRMDEDPRLGLLQTVPSIVNAATPFARLQQFANRLYGPVFAAGQAWWSGSEGNYWGHNAIIRVAAFAGCARLPHLTGPRPFGGHIMSHDFVEAALLRRGGWSVRTITGLVGSYEESPPTLLDTAARDRRWCQGNLQHIRVLPAAGLHWVSRLHLLCGVLAYVTPLLWLLLLVNGAMVWPAQHIALGSPAYGYVVALFAVSLGLLAVPKVLALVLALRDRELRRGFGGATKLILGVVVETLGSILMTPVMMVMQSVAVIEVLLGRDSGWSAQHRQGAELSRKDAWRAHGVHVLLGAIGAVGAFFLSKNFLIWTSPVFLSLTLSALLSVRTSRPAADAAARDRLFQIPEDLQPPRVLTRARALRAAYAAEAETRRRIEALLRQPAAVYTIVGGAAPADREAAADRRRAA
ncbi:glucans biosynthesis glucosyltransferase MdoH [Phenylobacterium sp. LjRoot219]|uniref:glucans biosynthesis glucosyltransferase MdoH n=1 Tax=Phenylobacterium sp. LjRoot219 TaxID=3342283 RepID=UPI003ECE0B28